ncbi:MAG: hypothetical protein PQJ61_12260 [Spirochaetales bacterium]|uniref:Uncharacterized protein n=1 Tax=Candidatus Thalassospirochaeta sargassi TaxID=3119039 RepID=A0AAJ1IG35_9SPIO|nr:hypothetical protein [Spirochaetales bacterium]
MDIANDLEIQKEELNNLMNEKIKALDSLDYEGFNELRFEFDVISFKLEIMSKQLELENIEKQISSEVV